MIDGLRVGSQQSYEIRVQGRIDPQWKNWFGGLEISTSPAQDGRTVTILIGVLADQAALFGVLNRIRDLGLRLISVNSFSPQLPQCQEPKSRKEDGDE